MNKTDLTPHQRKRAYRYTFTQIVQDTQTFICNALEDFHSSQYPDIPYRIGQYPEIWNRKPNGVNFVWFKTIGREYEAKEERLDLLAEVIIEIGLIIKGF